MPRFEGADNGRQQLNCVARVFNLDDGRVPHSVIAMQGPHHLGGRDFGQSAGDDDDPRLRLERHPQC
jgi:hypothetical protein